MIWQSQVIALLEASLVRPFVLAAAAWLLVWAFRIRHPASRHAVWTAVLIGMLLLPFASVIIPQWKLPVLPRKHESATQIVRMPVASTHSEALPSLTQQQTRPVFEASSRMFAIENLLLWCYLAGLLAMTAYRVMGWILLRRLVSRSRPLRAGPIRESDDVVTPVAVGVLRPGVILPIGWRAWKLNTLRAVLAHEFAHIRRRDALVLAFARFARCVLWFHPLAWWVSRKLANLAELACDAAALERVHDPAEYTRILIEFAGAANRAGHRVALPGLAMAAGSGMGKRIDQVFELSGGNLRKLARPVIVLAMTGVPVMCFAATVGFSESVVHPAEARLIPATSPITPAAPTPPTLVAQVPGPGRAQAPPATQRTASPDAPISLGLIIDNSGSMRDKRATATDASLALVNSSNPEDEIFIVSFDDESFLDQPSTNDKQKLEAAIRRSSARGGSAMWDAITRAIEYSRNGKIESKALVVITDGDDNSSHYSMQEMIRAAQDSGIAIYSIGLLSDEEPTKASIAKRALKALAEGTGGMDFYPNDQADLDQIIVQLGRQIRDKTRTPK
jgi:beta-lactamase regulating signal transducer with metallopeptidase domain